MTARLVISGWFLCGALAGCGVLPALESEEPAPSTPVDSVRPASNVDSLLAYFQHIRKLPAAELGKELESARQAFLSSRSDASRVRLAMLIALPGTALSDGPRALELLDPVAKNPGGNLHGLAVLLVAHLQERRRLDANVQGLQQKLDALMSLERTMIERKR